MDVRINRARERGWDSSELIKREKNQISVEIKRQRSTDIIDNSSTKESTFQQATKKWLDWGLNLPKELRAPSSLFFPEQ